MGRAREASTSTVHPSTPASDLPIDAPDANLANTFAVAVAKSSVVKVRGVANDCQKIIQGAGFVVAPNRVMSNAHAVAGADKVTVEVDSTNYDSHVVLFDPNADVSILDVPNLSAQPLSFAEVAAAKSGTDAVVLGYPGGREFVAGPARIREVIQLNGPDIYQTTTVNREVYTIRGTVRQGDSGGPLIDRHGRVLGVAFGAAKDDPATGFALTAREVAPQLESVGNAVPVATGPCLN